MGLSIAGNSVIDDSLIASIDATYVKTMTVAELTPNVMGESYAYTAGGALSGFPANSNTIDRFPFTTPFTTSTDTGDLTGTRNRVAGCNSSTDGYVTGLTIDKFPFSTPFVTATSAGSLSQTRPAVAGQSSDTYGYTSGGWIGSGANTIDRFPFSSPFTTASDIGDLAQGRHRLAGQSSLTNGYNTGGDITSGGGSVNTIDRFPFSTPFTTATDIGDLIQGRYGSAGHNSTTYGYSSGGQTPPSVNVIDRYPFSTPFTTSTDAGDLTTVRYWAAGQSSTTYGYSSAGYQAPIGAIVNTVDRFPFSSPFTTATDIGDIVQGRYSSAGLQD
jgi:hypothetical protein